MSVSGGPNIVEDGLVLYLDAGNPKSYPGSGDTWYDLSGTGNDFTFNSSSAESSWDNNWPPKIYKSGSSTIFSSVTPLTGISSNGTFIAWISASIKTQQVIAWGDTNTEYLGAVNTSNPSPYNANAGAPVTRFNAESSVTSSAYLTGSGQWLMYSDSSTDTTPWIDFRLGGYQNGFNYDGYYSVVMIYNRNLSVDELKQNFNALRGRFGI